MSLLLDRETAQKAVELVLPSVLALMANGTLKRHDLHIVIADPAFVPGAEVASRQWHQRGIIYEHSLGERDRWEHPYGRIARSKTHLSWRYGMPTQVLQARCPHLLQAGDTIFFGSAVSDGLVVGVSGVQPYFDQMIAAWVLEACRALCIEKRETGNFPNDGEFAESGLKTET